MNDLLPYQNFFQARTNIKCSESVVTPPLTTNQRFFAHSVQLSNGSSNLQHSYLKVLGR